MRYYIDTNTLVFYIQNTLDQNATDIINDYNNVIYLSSVSVTEFIHLLQFDRIKLHSHRITPTEATDFIENTLGFKIKYTDKSHISTYSQLPVYAEHTDPNDRLIIAQAMTERIPVISTDTKFPLYTKHGLLLVKARH